MITRSESSDFLYQIICTAFCVIIVLANIISAKIAHFSIGLEFTIPSGVLIYPVTFFMTDFVTEIYGSRKAKNMIYLALGMAFLSYIVIQLALRFPSNDPANASQFESVLGLSGIVLFASLTAYFIAQTLDVNLYQMIKKCTGERHLWLRNNGSTLVSQIADTFIVNAIYLYWSLNMEMGVVFKVMFFDYLYKAAFNLACTPLFYFAIYVAKKRYKEFSLQPNLEKV